MRTAAAVAVLTLCCAAPSRAQSRGWLIVPVSLDGQDASWTEATVAMMTTKLSRVGLFAESPDQSVALFQRRGSRLPSNVSDAEIEAWRSRSQRALRELARGNYTSARQNLEALVVTSQRAVDQFNREPNRAREVLDTCLYLARAVLETSNREQARRQTEACVRQVPRVEPSRAMHPPTVISLYREAVEQGAAHTGSLSVTSKPSGCRVRINGIGFGETPFETSALLPGYYLLQVECGDGQRGRLHPVRVGDGRTEVFVNVGFDRAIRAQPVLRLQYRDEKQSRERERRDARWLAKLLGVRAVVIAKRISPVSMQFEVVGGIEEHSGVARVRSTARAPSIEQASMAANRLARGECVDLTPVEPVRLPCGEDESPEIDGEAPPVSNRTDSAHSAGTTD